MRKRTRQTRRSEAEIQAMMAELDEPAASKRPQPQPQHPPIDQIPTDESFVEVVEPEDDQTTVQAMQQLLMRHEQSDLHRVEDPELKRVLDELRGLAHSNIIDVFQSEQVMDYVGVDDNGDDVYNPRTTLSVKDLSTLPREVTACIQQIEVRSTPGGDVVKIRMYDKQVALDKLMRFHGAYQRDNEQINEREHGVMDLLLSAIGSEGLPSIEDNAA